MKIDRARKAHLITALFFFTMIGGNARADESLESLDDPAPTTNSAAAPTQANPAANAKSVGAPSAPAPAVAEVALDLGGAGGEAAFNPYLFARTEAWSFLPIAGLMLVGLHLLRVPKRKSRQKLDQAKRFFRGLSGEGTKSSILNAEPTPVGERKDRRGGA